MDLLFQRVQFAAFHGQLYFLPEQPSRLLVYTVTLSQPDAIGPFFTGGYVVKHTDGLAQFKLQFVEDRATGHRLVVTAFAAPSATGCLPFI